MICVNFCGDVELDMELVLLIDDVCGGVLEQTDDASMLLVSILFSLVVCPLLILAETGNVEADLIICVGIVANDSSCKPRSLSNSFGSLAPGKSCLFATIKIGTS